MKSFPIFLLLGMLAFGQAKRCKPVYDTKTIEPRGGYETYEFPYHFIAGWGAMPNDFGPDGTMWMCPIKPVDHGEMGKCIIAKLPTLPIPVELK